MATFNEWASVYDPVITLPQGSEISIVITRVDVGHNLVPLHLHHTNHSFDFVDFVLQAATKIMEKEGSALADSPPMIAANEFLSGGKQITLIGGERFRRLRKAVHTHFQAKAVEMYKDTQFKQAKILVLDLLNDPKNHQKLAHRCVLGHFVCGLRGARGVTLGIPHLLSYVSRTANRVPHPSMIQSLLE